MTDSGSTGSKRGRGRPTGTTAARWKVRAALLQAWADARVQHKSRPTNAEIIAILKSKYSFQPGNTESAERIIRDERAALERHEASDPSNPFVGFFDLSMPSAAEIEARDARAAVLRASKRIKAALRRIRNPAGK
jgi:hypothetical protein